MFTNVTANAYQRRLNAGFSKVCAILKLCTIESLKCIWEFTHRFVIVVTFPRPETWRWMKPTVIGCLTCRSKGLMGGPWLNNAAIYCRPSSVSLNVCLRKTCARWAGRSIFNNYWDFQAQPSLGFTENGPKKRKYPVSGSCVDESALLMSEVRGEWTDWLQMIERQQ